MSRSRHAGWLLCLAVCLIGCLTGCLGSCASPSTPSKPPPHILLISTTGLRADAVSPRLTPQLDALANSAAWSGTAVAASSATVPSLASLITGLAPWQHQVLFGGTTRLDPRFVTLAEALSAQGYHSEAWVEGYWMQLRRGAQQGFDSYNRLHRDRQFLRRLAEVGDDPQFLWLHLNQPQPPFFKRPAFAAGLPLEQLRDLPKQLTNAQLLPYWDPEATMPEARRAELRAFYRQAVSWTDHRIGRFLDALAESGQLDRFVIVVTSLHGEALGGEALGGEALGGEALGGEALGGEARGDTTQFGHGNNLDRESIEVPLLIRLPQDTEARRLAVAPDEPVSLMRLWATLVESAGGRVPPAVAPSLFQKAPGGALSELYLTNGFNLFSWVDTEGFQLLRRVPFAPAEPEYHRARMRMRTRDRTDGDPVLVSEAPRRIFRRLDQAFQQTPPFTGNGELVQLELLRWSDNRPLAATPVTDAGKLQQLDDQLSSAWHSFLDRERPPAQETAHWR